MHQHRVEVSEVGAFACLRVGIASYQENAEHECVAREAAIEVCGGGRKSEEQQ